MSVSPCRALLHLSSLSLLAGALLACTAAREGRAIDESARIESAAPLERVDPSPSTAPVAGDGWPAALVHDGDSGNWTTGTLKRFLQYGFPGVAP
jgi:hypothetical protein